MSESLTERALISIFAERKLRLRDKVKDYLLSLRWWSKEEKIRNLLLQTKTREEEKRFKEHEDDPELLRIHRRRLKAYKKVSKCRRDPASCIANGGHFCHLFNTHCFQFDVASLKFFIKELIVRVKQKTKDNNHI